ncbi:hypothetical protein BKA63DRAFT_538910 [Paraphoma chrysanthemicola]|nr:hypothetical protein BKA63DRAFT_538910 [Paraphoma chrysanthemicola]
MQREADAFRIERENILRDAEEKRIRLEELLKESTEKSTALSSSVMQQQPINFHDTYGRKYTFPFSTCRTWVGMHDRIKRIYRDRQMWSELVASESFDLEDETGFIILPQDWSVFVQPGMSLALRFWPRPESSPEAVGSTIKRELVPVHKDLEKEQGEASSAEKEERPSWKRRKRFQRPLDTRNKWRSFEIFPSLATPKCPELTEVTITGFEGTQYKVHVNQLTGTYGQVKEALAFRHDWIKEILILSYADTIMADNELICASDLAGKILEVAGMASQYLPSEVTSSDTDLVLLDDDLNLDLDLGDMPSAIEIGRMDPKSAFHYAAKTEGFESNVQKPTPQLLQPKQFQDSNVEEPLKLGRRPKASRRITQQGLVEKVSLSEAEDEPEKVDKLTVRYGTGKAAEERAAGDGQTVPQLFSKVNMVEVNSGGKRVGRRSGPLIPQQRQQAHEIRAVPHRMRSEAHAPAPNVIIYNTTRMDNESSPNVRTEQRDPGPVRRRPSRRIPGESALEDQIAELQLELKREQRSRERSKQDEEGFDVIACICGSSEDDGNTVLCEVCETWQHIVCFYGPRPDIADVHECAECRPRHLDQNATIKAQGRRRSGKDQTDAHYQDGGRLAERKVKQAVKQRPKRSIMSPMASNTSLRMGDLEPQTPSSDPNTAELSAKGRQVQMPEDMQTAFKVGDEAQERNADTPARYSARMGPKESVLPNARRTPSLRTHTHSARHSLAMVRNQDPDSYSESSFEEDEWYTGYDRHIRTRPSHALKPPSNPKPLARLHSSTPPIQSVTPKMIMTQRRLREEEAEIRRKAAEDRAKVGDDQPNRSAFVHDPAAANLQRPESFPSRRLSVRQHAARMGTFRELLQHKRELLGRRYELDAILTGSIPQIERHQAESGMKRIVDELLNLELNLQREAQVLEGGFDPFAAPESQVRYTVSIGQAREIGSSDIKAEESRREGKARFEGSAAVQHRPYNPWQKPAGDHTRPQYDLQHTISMVNLHDETWHPKRPCSPATTSIAAYASGSAASSSLNYRQASARRPPPSLVANLPSARSPPSLSRSLSSSSPNLKAYDGFSSRKTFARHETKHNTGPTGAPPAVHPMTSATYVPGGESFGPGVGFPQLHVAAPRSSSPQSPEDVDSASIPLPQSPTLSGSVKFGSQAGPWSMHYSRNDTSPAALPIEQANHESAGSTGRFNVGLPVPTRRGHMAITVEDYSEDEDTFLYREMMEGLAGGESSEESEIEDDKVVLVEADRYEREDGKVDEVDELLREWTTVF